MRNGFDAGRLTGEVLEGSVRCGAAAEVVVGFAAGGVALVLAVAGLIRVLAAGSYRGIAFGGLILVVAAGLYKGFALGRGPFMVVAASP